MKTALFGGSFDPVHLGHLFNLHCAASQTDYSRFVIMPAQQSNFKRNNAPSATAQQRLQMLNLALEDFFEIYPQDCEGRVFEVSDLEIVRGGISYTLDTVNELVKEGDGSRIGVIIGDDHIPLLKSWYGFEELASKAEFLICPRNSTKIIAPEGIEYKILKTDVTAPESATKIREDVNKYASYLSPRVREYVLENGLYN
jgi:nicotinate-nucleotide adenylyltransferase